MYRIQAEKNNEKYREKEYIALMKMLKNFSEYM